MNQQRESGVIFLLLALIVAFAIVVFAFARAYQAHQENPDGGQSTSSLYKR